MPQSSGITARALRHLRRADPILAGLIGRVGPCRLVATTEGTHFQALVRTIVYQQLSGSAARTIYGRLTTALPEITPQSLSDTPDDTFRAAGLSRQKISYMRDLAAQALAGELALDRLHDLPDEEFVTAVSAVKGIGRWSAHMFLMFRLGRPDVLPELDLGIRKGAQLTYHLRSLPTVNRLRRLARPWAPYRSYASWYLWRALEL